MTINELINQLQELKLKEQLIGDEKIEFYCLVQDSYESYESNSTCVFFEDNLVKIEI